nr:TetR/AcrR family transcriptional regulator [Nocardia transvalensis]
MRNYERLVTAAAEVFADRGPQAPLDDIARAAGVGNATLYRHFPTRLALLEAVHRDRIEGLARRARELAETCPPAAALMSWLDTVAAQSSATRGLLTALLAVADAPDESWCRETIFASATTLLRSAQHAGEIRRDVTTSQLLKVVNAIAIATEQDPDPAGQAHALLAILFEGLRARP